MPADVLAKLIIAAVTVLLLLGLLISFLLPFYRKPITKTLKPYEEKLEYARKKRSEGKELIGKYYNSDSARTRNGLLKQAEEILWESRATYSELIDAHGEKGYGYLQTEIADVQANIYHCQKTRNITEFE